MSRDDQFGFEQCWTEYDENGRAMTFCDYSTDRGDEPPATEPPEVDCGQPSENYSPLSNTRPTAGPCQSDGIAHYPTPDDKAWGGYLGEVIAGAWAIGSNYGRMLRNNAKYGDKYYHCKANCEAARKGEGGKDAAEKLGWLREEAWGQKVKHDPIEDMIADYEANEFGLDRADDPGSCRDLCAFYRVNGIRY